MKKLMRNRWIVLCVRAIIGGIFIYSGFIKIQNPESFSDSIATFQLLPKELINILALALPPFELIVGTLMLIGWRSREAIFSVLLLSGIFILALVQALFRGLEVDCGCFGSGSPSIFKTWLTLGRDVVLLSAVTLLYRFSIASNHLTAKPRTLSPELSGKA